MHDICFHAPYACVYMVIYPRKGLGNIIVEIIVQKKMLTAPRVSTEISFGAT